MPLTSPMVCDMLAALEGASPSLSINRPLQIERRRGYVSGVVVGIGQLGSVNWGLEGVLSAISSSGGGFGCQAKQQLSLENSAPTSVRSKSRGLRYRYLTPRCPSESYSI